LGPVLGALACLLAGVAAAEVVAGEEVDQGGFACGTRSGFKRSDLLMGLVERQYRPNLRGISGEDGRWFDVEKE
jgi:hypothetical protein